jgi:hypothetical protein
MEVLEETHGMNGASGLRGLFSGGLEDISSSDKIELRECDGCGMDNFYELISRYSRDNNLELRQLYNGSLQKPEGFESFRVECGYGVFKESENIYKVLFLLRNRMISGLGSESYDEDGVVIRPEEQKIVAINKDHRVIVPGDSFEDVPKVVSREINLSYSPNDSLAKFVYDKLSR